MEFYRDIPIYIAHFSYAGILLCLILGSVGFPFPEDAILICSGLLISQNILSPGPTVTVVFAGMLVSDLIIISLGRRYGRRIVTHRWFRRVLSAKRLALIESRFNTHGTWVILIGRLQKA
jgi:membrane protein DedA with SNARE-associated domain